MALAPTHTLPPPPDLPANLEIRLHGRGGQGGVTCAKIIAAVFVRLGRSVQTFGDYAGERSGAPVRAYTRVSDVPIENRNKVYHPHHLVVLDPTLLSPDVVSGLVPGGVLLLNTPQTAQALGNPFPRQRLALVDATAIARRHKIGTRSVVIVNTTLAGALVRALNIPLEALEGAYRDLGLSSNFAAAKEAYDAVNVRSVLDHSAPPPVVMPGPGTPVLPLEEHVSGAPTGLKTGNWRTQTPRYTQNVAPCSAFCPAGNDVVGFIQALVGPGAQAAAEILGRTTPFSAVCGRVCPAPCMDGCNRTEHDGSVNIRALERWVASQHPVAAPRPRACANPKRVAVVGGGPAGLAAAYALACDGHKVTVLEGEKQLGGVLRTGIPNYRLPREELDREVECILRLGVEARCGVFLDPAAVARLSQDYDGVILATGLQKLRALDGPRTTPPGVEQGIHFLHRVNVEQNVKLSGRVVVLGGGNTAMDCARSALRCGATHVTVVYRRTRQEMPAISEEVDQAVAEGVEMVFLAAPLGFEGETQVSAVALAGVDLGPADNTGRRAPVVSTRRMSLPCDQVFLALGQSADYSLLPEGWTLQHGQFQAGGHALNVFAAGDVATGEGTVTHAIGDGRRAANHLLRALGLDVPPFQRPDRQRAVPATDIRYDHFLPLAPALQPRVPAQQRAAFFVEVEGGLPNALEAHRCFSCGHCTQCDTCLVYCPEGIIRRQTNNSYEVDYSFCKGCGICVSECPRKAMEMTAA